MIIFDTDIVSLHSQDKNEQKEKIDQRARAVQDEVFAVTIITRMEILRGRFDSILKAANAKELERAVVLFQLSELVLSRFSLLTLNQDAMGRFEALKKTKGLKIRQADLLIACITLAHKALLVTRNIEDFRRVPQLRLENWAD